MGIFEFFIDGTDEAHKIEDASMKPKGRFGPRGLNLNPVGVGHDFISFGFPDSKPMQGLEGKGTIQTLNTTSENGFPLIQLEDSNSITQGFSGSPVFDTQIGGVIGIINEGVIDTRNLRQLGTSFAVPIDFVATKCQDVYPLEITASKPFLPKLAHLYQIEDVKNDNKFLFDNDLTFFTEQEIENHQLLIRYLKDNRACLLIGNPATGKSISVVAIGERLANSGIGTYYYSFKKRDRWAEVWAEIISQARPEIVFILDDIHLDLEAAQEALIKLQSRPDVRILFISREINNTDMFDDISIIKELTDYTVEMENPNIDEKVKGIAKTVSRQTVQPPSASSSTGSLPGGKLTQVS